MSPPESELGRLRAFFTAHARPLIVTGAGLSTASGIPAYRDGSGAWVRPQPVQFQDFVRSASVRQRYWARSFLGWPQLAAARPNGGHRALAALEAGGRIAGVVTQNVDGLHQRAGSRRIVDLHGRLDRVICLDCRRSSERAAAQAAMAAANADWRGQAARYAPDGDADPVAADYTAFRTPACDACGGVLKPDVVFFGEQVPKPRVARCLDWLSRADALLVIGSSLMVWSGYRFVRAANAAGKPVAVVNVGRTRADAELALKIEADCVAVLQDLAEGLGTTPAGLIPS